MGEVAHCRFTWQHASGQLTAGTYPPVSVDVALAAALNRQRWAERTAKSTCNVWATQERAKQTKGRSPSMQTGQGYKNAASNKVTRAKEELLSHQSPAHLFPKHFLSPAILGTYLFFDSSQSLKTQRHNSHTTALLPLTLHDICLLWSLVFSPLPNRLAQIHRTSASPLATILACITRTVHPHQGPDRTLPSHYPSNDSETGCRRPLLPTALPPPPSHPPRSRSTKID
jgi:hypothetical protein